ncbi:ATP synthase F1 subunit delta [Lachnospiraceae bacterium LCP25S3_G4]
MAKLVSKTYGDALFGVAMDEQRLDEIYGEVQSVIEVLRTNEELTKLMNHPKIIKEDKVKIIEETFKDRVCREIIGLMTLLITKGHFADLESVFAYFVGLVKEEKKIGIAYVTTAIPLVDTQKEAIVERLLRTTRYESFEMQYSVDESLIGGMIIRIGDRVVDSSIKTKLNELSRNLKKIQVGV